MSRGLSCVLQDIQQRPQHWSSLGSYDKVPHTGRFINNEVNFSQFWGWEVQDQDQNSVSSEGPLASQTDVFSL